MKWLLTAHTSLGSERLFYVFERSFIFSPRLHYYWLAGFRQIFKIGSPLNRLIYCLTRVIFMFVMVGYESLGVMIPLKASVVKNTSSLFTNVKSKHNPNKDRLELKQTWHGMNRVDSPTAGYNINTRPETEARTWLLITNKEGHMTRTNQWKTGHMTKTTNKNMTHWTMEPIAKKTWGQGKHDTNRNHNQPSKSSKTCKQEHGTEPKTLGLYHKTSLPNKPSLFHLFWLILNLTDYCINWLNKYD